MGIHDTDVDEKETSVSEVRPLFSEFQVLAYQDSRVSASFSSLCEDIHSRIFHEFDEVRYTRCLCEDV